MSLSVSSTEMVFVDREMRKVAQCACLLHMHMKVKAAADRRHLYKL